MGTFMASVAFRRTDGLDWNRVKPAIEEMFSRVEGLVSNLNTEGYGYAIVSPYGDLGRVLADLPDKISALTEDYAVFAVCVDSDFCMMELYHNGILLEKSCVHEPYMEFQEFESVQSPDAELWKPLLLDQQSFEKLDAAFTDDEVFVEDQLREISALTGLPIFDDQLVYGEEW